LRWLRSHQTYIFLIVLAGVTWGTVWLIYDYRSPVNQYLRAFGSVQIDGWSYNDLDAVCIRLEPANGTPAAAADGAGRMAAKAYPGGYVREIMLVSFHDTCRGSSPQLAWAVSVSWPAAVAAPSGRGNSPPRAIVLVDAKAGTLIVSDAANVP
jgi:hypothetical protein